MYQIRDLQFQDRLFADGETFATKQEACEQLIDYHSVDCDMSMEQKLLDKGQIDKCWDYLTDFEWALEEI